MSRSSILVSTDWLAANLGSNTLRVVDGSWYLPMMNRKPAEEFLAGHIPGAVHFDIDTVRDTASPLPHMLPSADVFAAAAGAMGLSEEHTIVVYDGAGLFSAPRVRWMFNAYGARDVRILDGGLPQWISEGRPLEQGPAAPAPAHFDAHLDLSVIADLGMVRGALADGTAQVVDARPADRFRGDAPEPRPGVRAGHMPGSLNVPFSDLVSGGRLAPDAEIVAAFRRAGVDPSRPIITSCGSGVSAAILWLGLEIASQAPDALYDGSWAEWGSTDDCAVVTGP
jgi:thiosulfate/3-mercaptopyruvate sulfurtransferase